MVESPRWTSNPSFGLGRSNRSGPLAPLRFTTQEDDNDGDDEDPPGLVRADDHPAHRGNGSESTRWSRLEEKLRRQDQQLVQQNQLMQTLIQQLGQRQPPPQQPPRGQQQQQQPHMPIAGASLGDGGKSSSDDGKAEAFRQAGRLGRDAAQQVLSNIQSAAAAAVPADAKQSELAQINARAQMLVDGIARSMLESVERFEQNPQQEVIAFAVRAFQQKLQELNRNQPASNNGLNQLGIGPEGDPDSIPPHLLPDLQQAQINEVIQHQREAYLCEREWKQNRSEYVNSHKSSVLLFADLVQAVSNLAKPYLQGLGFSNLPGMLEQVIEEPEVKRQLQRAFAMRDEGYVTDPNLYVRTRYLHAILKDLLHKPSQDVLTAGVNVAEAAAHRLSRPPGTGGAANRRQSASPAVPQSASGSASAGGRRPASTREYKSPSDAGTAAAAGNSGDLPLRPRVRRARATPAASTNNADLSPDSEGEKKNDSVDKQSKMKSDTLATRTTPATDSSITETCDVKADSLEDTKPHSVEDGKQSMEEASAAEFPELELTEEERARAEASEQQQSDGQLAAVVSSLNKMATRLQHSGEARAAGPDSSVQTSIAQADQKFRNDEADMRRKLAERARIARSQRF
jgi:hypothetical protein